MKNNYLMNQGLMFAGLYRAYVIYREDYRVYIPGLMVEKLLNDNGSLDEELYKKNKKIFPIALFDSQALRKLVGTNTLLGYF